MDSTGAQQNVAAGTATVAEPAAPSSLKIFINYRHDDLGGTAWALYGTLVQRFGKDNVFFDNGTLQPGDRWLDEIKQHLAGSGVVLSMIGPKWMAMLLERMQRSEEDFVAKEISLAFELDHVTVIPLLFDDAQPPDPEQLPPAIKGLAACQAERLRTTHLGDDMDRLVERLDALARDPAPFKHVGVPILDPDAAAARVIAERAGDTERDPVAEPEEKATGPTPDDSHYESVVEEADNLVVFLGASINADESPGPWKEDAGVLPDDAELARYLAMKVRIKSDDVDLAEVAQRARTLRGEPRVFQWVKQALSNEQDPGPVHRYIAHLPKRLEELGLPKRHQMIVTTKYDAELERAFRLERVPFDVAVYMGPGTDQPGTFVHVPWEGAPKAISEPNDYLEFPIGDDGQLMRTVIVRINGVVDDRDIGYTWKDNYVITEDHYIDFLSGRSAEDLIPGQILAKLQEASCLFLGYTLSDWRLRVFLKRIWKGEKLGRARCWAIQRDPDEVDQQLWLNAGVALYGARLTDYVAGFDAYLVEHRDELRE